MNNPLYKCGVCKQQMKNQEDFDNHFRMKDNDVLKCKNRWDKNGIYNDSIDVTI